jgi:exopolysaccharide biosynthesis polyprenyl glycosylphosphotransferase
MHQTITKPSAQEAYRLRRARQPVLMKRAQFLFVAALVLLDAGCAWLAYFLAHRLLLRDPNVLVGPFLEFWPLPLLNMALIVAIFFSQRMYQRRRPASHLDEFFKIIVYNTFAVLLTVALLGLALTNFDPHRRFIIYAWAVNIGLLTILRGIHAQVQWSAQARGIGDDRVLIIGAGEVGQMLLQKIRQNRKLGYQVVGIVDNGRAINTLLFSDTPVLGVIADIPWIIEKYGIDEVIIGLPESSHQELVGIISLCEREKVGIRVFPDVFQIMASEVGIGDLGGLPLLTIRDVALRGWKLTLKRGMDLVLSVIGLILFSPFMLLMALLIKLESPGPVFHVQERMGLDARPFKIIKFRSMRRDAESDGPGWTVEQDPRRTKLGGFLRRFNIDELPQLVNILVGDMSLVGPRPERPVYVEQFRQIIPRYMDRHREKAGLTGWAQVNGLRGDTSIVERTKYDLWYIENWSLALDIKILLRTIVQWIMGTNENAY